MCNTVILQCTCKHSFQDKTHTSGWRVHNTNGKANWWERVAYCTVCGNVKVGEETLHTKEWITEHSEWNR